MALVSATREGSGTAGAGRGGTPKKTPTNPGYTFVPNPERTIGQGPNVVRKPAPPAPAAPSPTKIAGSISGGAVAGAPAVPVGSSPGGTGSGLQPAQRGARVQFENTPNWADFYVPGQFAGDPGNKGRYLLDPYGNFLEGDADTYVKEALGSAPATAPVDPSQAASVEDQYMRALANYDTADQYANQGFEEQRGYIDRNKGKSLGSLANSMADRGLTNSGIFFGATGDVNNAALEQLNSAGRSRDMIVNQNQTGRVDAGRVKADTLTNLANEALKAAIERWQSDYDQRLEAARSRNAQILKDAGLA